MRRLALFILVSTLTSVTLFGQVEPNLENGFKPYGSYDTSKVDSVNLLNRNLSLTIPVLHYPQRGSLTHSYYLIYNAKKWAVTEYCDPRTEACRSWWMIVVGGSQGVNQSVALVSDGDYSGSRAKFGTTTVRSIVDWTGSSHILGPSDANPLYSGYVTYRTADGSGYVDGLLCTQPLPGGVCGSYAGYDRSKNGNLMTPQTEDTNGNLITDVYPNPSTDTIGRPLLDSWTSTSSDSTGCLGPRPISVASIRTVPGFNGTAQIKTCSVSIALKTNFQAEDELGQPIKEYTGNTQIMQSFIIYDGNSWTTSPQWVFEYADNAGGTNYGDLTKITFPTGGTISYQWETDSVCNTGRAGATPMGRSLVYRSTNANDGSGTQTWTYGVGTLPPGNSQPAFARRVSDPLGNDTIHVFSYIGSSGCSYQYETEAQWYSGSQASGTLLKTVLTQYRSTGTSLPDMSDGPLIAGILPTVVTTQWPNGKQSQVQTDYVDTDGVTGTINLYDPLGKKYAVPVGNVIETREYNFQSGGMYSLARRTHYTYKAFQDSNCFNRNMLDRVSSVSIYDGNNNLMAQTTYGYDESSLQPSGVVSAYLDTTVGTYRGNQTSVSRWVSASAGSLKTSTSYYDSGMPYNVTDPGGHTTTYSYSTTYQGAYVTQTQKPDTNSPSLAHHVVSGTYDLNTGLLTGYTDENNNPSSFSYDSLARMLSASFPGGGSAAFSYPDLVTVKRSQAIDSSRSLLVEAKFDGLGRLIRKATANDGTGASWIQGDTCYDGDSRSSFTSYAYQSSSADSARDCSGATTPGDGYSYDGLDRVTSIVHSDGSSILKSYKGAAVMTTDEGSGVTGRLSRVSQPDALGRLISVCEVSAPTGPGNPAMLGFGATAVACGQDIAQNGYLTTYQYDALGNLLSENQGGYTARTFHYDGVSRLTDATNPESGLVTYTYWPDGMVNTRKRPLPNQTATDSSHQVTTTYTYDELHRQRSISYDKGTTPTSNFNYDEATVAGHSTVNGIGHLTSEYTANTGEYFWNFDQMGRAKGRSQCVPSRTNPAVCSSNYDFSYTVNYLGAELTAGLPTGVTLTSAYDAAARLQSLSSNLADNQHPSALLASAQYGPFGMTGATLGNIYTEQLAYTTRGWLSQVSDSKAGTTLYNFTILGSGGFAPDGDILQVNDSVNGNWTYTYDSFNRLSTAVAGSTGCSYVYDRFGNRWQQNVYNGSCSTDLKTFTMNAGTDNNNRMDGGALYDAPGNLVHDPNSGRNYTYDAEGRLIASGTYSYVYDAEGRRVAKQNGSSITAEYLFDNSGAQQIELDGSGSVVHTNVFNGGKLLATYKNDGQTYFHFSDWLGTRRKQVRYYGNSTPETCTSLPFGDQLTCSGGADATEHHFTGKERDSESGLDNFEARYDASSLGRFMTPDPMGGHLENPQSLNKYAYVLNNPTSLTDPTGLDSYLSCTQTKDNASTCQSQTVGYDKNGVAQTATVQGVTNADKSFTATQIGNDANGNLVDKTTGTGSYTASANGSGVQFSNNGGQTSSTGVFVNGTPQNTFQDAGFANGGALSGFTFTLTNSKLEAGQTEAGSFTFAGTPDQAGAALQKAGFNPRSGENVGMNEYRSPGSFWTGANSAHFNVFQIGLKPWLSVPQAQGDMHFGEHDPQSVFGGPIHFKEWRQ